MKYNYNEIAGDLITFAKEGKFDVIAHGCNCFCTMRRGVAPQMNKAFNCNDPNIFPSESPNKKGDVNKLGTIEYTSYPLRKLNGPEQTIQIVNAYTQYHYNWTNKKSGIPLDYEAFRMCMMKINEEFSGAHIGLPQIGCGLAGGDWEKVKGIIQEELTDCTVTVVIYNT